MPAPISRFRNRASLRFANALLRFSLGVARSRLDGASTGDRGAWRGRQWRCFSASAVKDWRPSPSSFVASGSGCFRRIADTGRALLRHSRESGNPAHRRGTPAAPESPTLLPSRARPIRRLDQLQLPLPLPRLDPFLPHAPLRHDGFAFEGGCETLNSAGGKREGGMDSCTR